MSAIKSTASKITMSAESRPMSQVKEQHLVKGRHGASDMPLDYLTDWSAPKFWRHTITETPEQVMALANDFDVEAVRRRARLRSVFSTDESKKN